MCWSGRSYPTFCWTSRFSKDGFAARGSGLGLAPTIPVGMRAVSVRVNDVAGVAGFVLPGMHVDVLVTGEAADRRRRHDHHLPAKTFWYFGRGDHSGRRARPGDAGADRHAAGVARRRPKR